MQKIISLLALLALPLASACAGTIDKRTVWQGANAKADAPSAITAQSQSEWTQLWGQIGRNAPLAELPNGKMAVAIMIGMKRTGGYRVEIVDARENADHIAVAYRIHEPPMTAMVTQALTSPYAVTLLNKSSKPVRAQQVP